MSFNPTSGNKNSMAATNLPTQPIANSMVSMVSREIVRKTVKKAVVTLWELHVTTAQVEEFNLFVLNRDSAY